MTEPKIYVRQSKDSFPFYIGKLHHVFGSPRIQDLQTVMPNLQ